MSTCPSCGKVLSHWHFYGNYGRNGAFYCYRCHSLYKAIRDRKTHLLKLGKFIKVVRGDGDGIE